MVHVQVGEVIQVFNRARCITRLVHFGKPVANSLCQCFREGMDAMRDTIGFRQGIAATGKVNQMFYIRPVPPKDGLVVVTRGKHPIRVFLQNVRHVPLEGREVLCFV